MDPSRTARLVQRGFHLNDCRRRMLAPSNGVASRTNRRYCGTMFPAAPMGMKSRERLVTASGAGAFMRQREGRPPLLSRGGARS